MTHLDIPRPFWEHIEELRLRLIKSLVAIGIASILSYPFIDQVIVFLSRPVGKFIFIHPTEAIFVRLKISLFLGILIAIPIVIYQLWKFVSIAAFPGEHKILRAVLPVSYALFLIGFTFGFFVLIPICVHILIGYGNEKLVPSLSIEAYINFVGSICLILGGVFQLPLVSFFLAYFGLLKAEILSEKRRVAILIIYIFSAIVTPGPDPVSAILLAVPSYLLFECSIFTCIWAIQYKIKHP